VSPSSRSVVLIAAAVLVAVPVTAVSPSTRYRMVDLGTLVLGGHSAANAINDRGQIVGASSPRPECDPDDPCQSTAVLWEGGRITALLTPTPASTAYSDMNQAVGINQRGQIIGYVHRISSYFAGFLPLLWQHGSAIGLQLLDDERGWEAAANGINERGQIVGWSIGLAGYGRAVLWQNGTIVDLGLLPATGSWSEATAINNRGQIVGWNTDYTSWTTCAFLWDRGTVTELALPTGPGSGEAAQALGINDGGQIVGWLFGESTGQTWHAVLWEGDTITDLGTLSGQGYSFATAINNRGQIVGYSSSVAGTTHAVLWERDTITDLGTLIGSRGQSAATAINNRGQIVGYSSSAAGRLHAVLWEPNQASK
jgi:probable HAF family extracellular repeat protein